MPEAGGVDLRACVCGGYLSRAAAPRRVRQRVLNADAACAALQMIEMGKSDILAWANAVGLTAYVSRGYALAPAVGPAAAPAAGPLEPLRGAGASEVEEDEEEEREQHGGWRRRRHRGVRRSCDSGAREVAADHTEEEEEEGGSEEREDWHDAEGRQRADAACHCALVVAQQEQQRRRRHGLSGGEMPGACLPGATAAAAAEKALVREATAGGLACAAEATLGPLRMALEQALRALGGTGTLGLAARHAEAS